MNPGPPPDRAADVVVVGAGIVGLATAVELQRRRPGLRVVVLDKEDGPARHQTGRNSGVVHSGIYYAPGSAKAALVARGRRLLEAHCATHDLPFDRCGKVIVATSTAELAALGTLEQGGRDHGLRVRRIGPAELHTIEPHVSGIAALHVPDAAITDYGGVARSLADDLAAGGGALVTGAEVTGIERTGRADGEFRVTTGRGDVVAERLVNCAGLHSDRIARMAGATTAVSILPFRGEYHELTPATRHLVRHLVYPVPDPRWPFLGVHMTRMVDGSIHVGPNAVLAGGRESYRRGIDRGDALEMLRSPALRHLARSYWRTGAEELVRSRSSRLLLRDVRRLLPEVGPDDLVASSSGIRAQAVDRAGRLLDDFAFADSPGAVHVLNAPSPAATASLAIAEVVAERLFGDT